MISSKNLLFHTALTLGLLLSALLYEPAFAQQNKRIISLGWEEIEGASSYEIEVESFDENNKLKWKRRFKLKTPKWDAKIPLGNYSMKIRTYDQRGVPGEWGPAQNFTVEPPEQPVVKEEPKKPEEPPEKKEEKVAKSKEKLKKPKKKESRFSFVATYLITEVSYTAIDKFNDNRPNFETLGGTGRLGVDYRHPKSSWGGSATIDMGGFTIDSQNYTFNSAELLASWRNQKLGNHIEVKGGIYSKELPSLQGNSLTGLEGVGKVTTRGPMLGARFWRPFGEKLGLEVNAYAYYGMMGEGPNGETISTEMSTQFGVLGSYDIMKKLRGYAGIALRTDKAAYETITNAEDSDSFAQEGDINEVELSGMYINLILQYDF